MTCKSIEVIARGVLISRGRILLVRKKNGNCTFLPGGHIERGESAEKALVREIREETGFRAINSYFLGAVEHAWKSKGRFNEEINLIFKIKCKALCRLDIPVSRESKLEFFWQPLHDLKSVNLQPSVLQKLLPRWFKAEPANNWGTTL